MTNGTPEPDIATIRQLLLAAFTSATLPRFCRDRPIFRPVLDEFGPGQGLTAMVDELIAYCETRVLFEELLTEIQAHNPKQYARFEARLLEQYHAPSPAPGLSTVRFVRPTSKRAILARILLPTILALALAVALWLVLSDGLQLTPTSAPTRPEPTPIATPSDTLTPTLRPTSTPTRTMTLTPIPSDTPDLAATEQARTATQAAASTATWQVQQTAKAAALQATGRAATATTLSRASTGDFSIAGGSTLEKLTDAILEAFREDGYVGNVDRRYREDGGTARGTEAGFRDFCSLNDPADVVLVTGENLEKPYLTPEMCPAGRVPIGFPVGSGKVDVGNPNERYEPLFLFTTEEILTTKPQVAAFFRFYLEHVYDLLPRFNDFYLPVSPTQLDEARARLDAITR